MVLYAIYYITKIKNTMKTKTLLAALILLIGFITVNATDRPRLHEEKLLVENWMATPFFETIFSYGSTNNEDYVIVQTETIYHFMGKEYKVYSVMYDDPMLNIKVGIKDNEYIAYTDDFIFFYACDKNGFGVRRALFKNTTARDKFDGNLFREQTILCANKKIDDTTALKLIAAYVPNLKYQN